jgi:hypothetical protein
VYSWNWSYSLKPTQQYTNLLPYENDPLLISALFHLRKVFWADVTAVVINYVGLILPNNKNLEIIYPRIFVFIYFSAPTSYELNIIY